jgi:hypothetical protein
LWHKASEAKASNLRQVLGEQRKCMDGRPRLPSTRMTPSRLGEIEIPQRSNGLPCRDVLSLFGGAQRFAASQLG